MTECFKQIPIDIYPLSKPIEEFLVDWPEKRMDKLVDSSFLNPELLKYFKRKKSNFVKTLLYGTGIFLVLKTHILTEIGLQRKLLLRKDYAVLIGIFQMIAMWSFILPKVENQHSHTEENMIFPQLGKTLIQL